MQRSMASLLVGSLFQDRDNSALNSLGIFTRKLFRFARKGSHLHALFGALGFAGLWHDVRLLCLGSLRVFTFSIKKALNN